MGGASGATNSESQSNASAEAGTAGAATGGSVTVSLVQQPTTLSNGMVTVTVPKDTATSGSGFSFPLPEQLAQAATATASTAITVTTLKGDPLPAWLQFVPESNTFVASAVPDGAFPIQVVVIIGGQSTIVVISERAE